MGVIDWTVLYASAKEISVFYCTVKSSVEVTVGLSESDITIKMGNASRWERKDTIVTLYEV